METKTCPKCGKLSEFNVCQDCGVVIQPNSKDGKAAAANAYQTAELVECGLCQGKISSEAISCPHCGHPIKTPAWGDLFVIVLKVLVIVAALPILAYLLMALFSMI